MHQDSPRPPASRLKALLPALMALVLCVLSLAPAHAQTFRIEPVTGITSPTSSRADENTDPQFRVVLTGGDANTDFFFNLTVTPNTGALRQPQPDVDYDPRSIQGTFSLRPGQNRVFTLDVYDDESFEQFNRNNASEDEQLFVTLTSGNAIEAGRNRVTYGIIDNDTRPTVRVRDVQVAIADRTDEARFVEGAPGANTPQNFTVELVGASGQPGFRNNQNQLVRVTSIEGVTFDFDFQNGNGTDPTSATQAESQRAPDSAVLGTDFNGSFNNAVAAPPTTDVDRNGVIDARDAAGQIPIGSSRTLINFSTVGDAQDENNETFIVRVLNPRNTANPSGPSSVNNPAGTQGFGVILDDDAPVVTVSDASVTEGNLGSTVQATFRVELSAPSVQPILIDFFTRNGTAIDFVRGPNTVPDYQGTGGTLLFAPGQTLLFINVTVNGDNISEGGTTGGRETFSLRFFPNNGLNYDTTPNPNAVPPSEEFVRVVPETVQRGLTFGNNATQATATGSIIDDDVASISIDDASVVEGDGAGQTVLNFTVRLTNGATTTAITSENTISVTAQTQPGPAGPTGATSGVDFVANTQTVTIPAGQSSAVFQVLVNNDDIDEMNEILFVNLSNASPGSVIADNQAVGTIIDNDGPQISINDVTQAEGTNGVAGNTGTTPFVFRVTLSAASVQDVSVNYRTTDGTAVSNGANPDFTAIGAQPTQTLVIPAGQTTGTITVNVNADNIYENLGNPETFQVVLSGAQNAAPTPFTKAQGTGTINNDDSVPVVSVNDVRAVEGQNEVFTISLSNPSTQAITVPFMTNTTGSGPTVATPGADYVAVTNGSVTFNPASFNGAGQTSVTVSIPTVDDTIAEANETFSLDLGTPTPNGAATLGKASGTATIVDNDGPSVSIADAAPVTEGNSGTVNANFPVTLSTASPQAITLNYTVANGTATAPGDFNNTPGSITIPAGSTTGTITVPVVGDLIDESNETFSVTITVAPATGAAAGEPAAATVARGTAIGTIIDDDSANFIVTPTTLTTSENGTSATFTVSLTSQPTADVVIPITSGDTTEGTVSPSTLLFTASNFSSPRTVTVTGVNDSVVDGSVTYSVLVGPAQSADPGYSGLGPVPVTVTNTDNDQAALSLSIAAANLVEGTSTTATVTRNTLDNSQPLTISVASSSPSVTVPATVTIPSGAASVSFTVTAPDNSVADGNRTATISATSSGFAPSNGVSVMVSDNDSAGVLVTPTSLNTSENGTSAAFTVRLTSQPTAPVTVSFASSNTREVTVAPVAVTFTTQNFAVPQTVTVTGVDDKVADGPQKATISSTVASADAAYNGIVVAPVTVTNADNDVAGFTVTPTSGLVTSEAGGSATFTVALNTTPTANVTIALTSSNTAEGTVSPSTLTFTPLDRGPKTVTVTGVDDLVADGSVAYRIVLSPAVSNDPSYSGLDPADVTVANTDNDTANVLVSTRSLTTSEAGGSDTFTVSLTSKPASNVTINAASSDPTEGTTEPSSLVFTPENYATPQTVRVTGVDDAFVDGNVAYSIRLSIASNDAVYARQVLPTIAATNLDNDVANVIVTAPFGGLRVSEAGTSASFTVRLIGQPMSNVVFPLTVDKPGEAKLSASSIVFTPDNYAAPKTITVTGVNDFIADGSQPFTINIGPSVSTDPAFNRLRPPSVTGLNADNDRVGVSLSPLIVTLSEGARGTATIRLLSQPTAAVKVVFESRDTTELLTPAPITLNAGNYRTGVAIPLQAVKDSLVDSNVQVLLRVRSLISSDRNYNIPNVTSTTIRVTVNNIDQGSIRVSKTALSLTEGQSATLQVSLRARPAVTVRVLLRSTNTALGNASPSSLVFTPTNYNLPQTVTVRTVNNTSPLDNAPFSITTTAVAPGNPYNNVSGPTVQVTSLNDDDAEAPTVTVDTPTNGNSFQSVVAVTGMASDNKAVARVEVTVARLNAAGTPVAYLQNSGTFSATPAIRTVAVNSAGNYTLVLPRLEVGRYQITARAFDASNNVSLPAISTFSITDAPTTISIDSPSGNAPINPRALVRGTVTTRNSLTAAGVTVTVRSGTRVVRTFKVKPVGNTFSTEAFGNLAQGTYTIVASATDIQGNTVTDSVTVLVDNTPPTSVAITSVVPNQVVDNLFEVRGTATDSSGGSGLGRVELAIKRRTDNTYFNGRSFQTALTTVRARIVGNTWVYTLPAGLPADPDPLNAVYSLQAIAFDRAGNALASSVINILLRSNGSSGSGTSGTTTSTTTSSSVVAAGANSASPLRLSTIAASQAEVSLAFTGALDGVSASNAASYEVSVEGRLVKLDGARSSGSSVVLSLPSGEAGVGDTITVAYSLRDAQGLVLRNTASAQVR